MRQIFFWITFVGTEHFERINFCVTCLAILWFSLTMVSIVGLALEMFSSESWSNLKTTKAMYTKKTSFTHNFGIYSYVPVFDCHEVSLCGLEEL